MQMTTNNAKDGSRRQEDKDSTALAIPSFPLPRTFRDFMTPFDEFMAPFLPTFTNSLWSELGERQPIVDFQDRGSHYLMTAELPGFEKKDVQVNVSPNSVELRAEKRSKKESKSKDAVQSQTSESYFHRYLTLPEEVLPEKVGGTMKNGVLELKLPKKEPKTKDESRRVDLK